MKERKMKRYLTNNALVMILAVAFVIAVVAFKTRPEKEAEQTQEEQTQEETMQEEEEAADIEKETKVPYKKMAQKVTEARTETEAETETETEKQEQKAAEQTQAQTIEVLSYELVFEPYDSIPLSYETQYGIWKIACEYEFEFEFLLAWGMQESGLNPLCIGDDGQAYGMYQIQPKWWQGLADEHGLDLWDPIDNCECACIILNKYLEHTKGDYTRSLSIYRWGNEDNKPERDGRTYEEHIKERYEDLRR